MRRRRRVPQTDAGVTLFPFMAVLICTMGTLIVILMVVVRQAKVRADTVAEHRREELEAAAADREAKTDRPSQLCGTRRYRSCHPQRSVRPSHHPARR